MRCEDKIPYGSELLASNAAVLHAWAYPDCLGVAGYQCPSCREWHVGHVTQRAGQLCHQVPKPLLYRPRHKPRARMAAAR